MILTTVSYFWFVLTLSLGIPMISFPLHIAKQFKEENDVCISNKISFSFKGDLPERNPFFLLFSPPFWVDLASGVENKSRIF